MLAASSNFALLFPIFFEEPTYLITRYAVGRVKRDASIDAARLLASALRERRCRRAAEQRDELAALQKLHSPPRQPDRIAGYQIGEERSAGIRAFAQPGQPLAKPAQVLNRRGRIRLAAMAFAQ
jgi:hypothetical protein